MTIRKATSEDLVKVVELVVKFLVETRTDYEQPDVVGLVSNYLRSPTSCVFLAEEGGICCGCMLGYILFNVFNSGIMATDRLVYVEPEFRNKVACRQLYLAFERWAKDNHCDEIVINVVYAKDNDAVRRVVEYMRFNTVGYLLRKAI